METWLKDYRNENLILCGLRYSIRRATYQCGDGCGAFAPLLPLMTDRAVLVALRDLELWEEQRQLLEKAGGRSLQMPEDEEAVLDLLRKTRAEVERRKLRR